MSGRNPVWCLSGFLAIDFLHHPYIEEPGVKYALLIGQVENMITGEDSAFGLLIHFKSLLVKAIISAAFVS